MPTQNIERLIQYLHKLCIDTRIGGAYINLIQMLQENYPESNKIHLKFNNLIAIIPNFGKVEIQVRLVEELPKVVSLTISSDLMRPSNILTNEWKVIELKNAIIELVEGGK